MSGVSPLETLPVVLRIPRWQQAIYIVIGAFMLVLGILIVARGGVAGRETFTALILCAVALLLIGMVLAMPRLGLLVEEEGLSFTDKGKKYSRVPWTSIRSLTAKPLGVGYGLAIEMEDKTVLISASRLGMRASQAADALNQILSRKR